ncbi:MAG: hypothetical protein ABL949_11555, partial [Fimbriimonadaceae bacterium]
KKGFNAKFPTLGYHTRGVSYSEMIDVLQSLGKGGLDVNKLGDYARKFGGNEKSFGVYGDMTVTYGSFSLGFSGDVLVNSVPNASLQNKIATGNNNFDLNDALDGYGYGFTSIDLGYGHLFESKDKSRELAAGFKLRFLSSHFTHHTASGNQILTGGGSTAAPEMNGNRTLSKSGVGLDLGLQMVTNKNLYYALTIDNFLVPSVGFDTTLPKDFTLGNPNEHSTNPFKPRYSVGVAYNPVKPLLLAADWVDVGNHRGEKEVRLGAEFMVANAIGGRIGFSGRNGVTMGFTLAGVNVSFGKRNPLAISSGFKF